MNWVGGSRSRLTTKDDAKKQRDFFEKIKMQKKLKNLGLTLPTSPGASGPGSGSASLDLLTLFIVNQIATKKENKDRSKAAVLGSCSRKGPRKQNKPLVLPMSPCSPSQLSLVEAQQEYSLVPGRGKGRHVIRQGFKYHALSPVLESAFSDNSASDYLPPTTDFLSPFSSASSASSGQGVFPLQLRGLTQTQLPPPWETSALEQTKPFSQPRDMTEGMTWLCGSNRPLYPLETPTAAPALFGSPEPHVTETGRHKGHKVMDITVNPSETEQQSDGFCYDGSEKNAFQLRSTKSKIYLKNETPVKSSAPQTVPESHLEMESCSCIDTHFSCPGHNTDPENGCGYSPSYSCGGCSLISDSHDDCCADTRNQGPQGKLKQKRHSQSGPRTPLTAPTVVHSSDEMTWPLKPPGSDSLQAESSATRSASQILSVDLCKCNKSSAETRDAGTQTVDNLIVERHDASTQCSFITDCAANVQQVNFPPVKSILPPATRGQMDATAETNAHAASAASRGKQTAWSKMMPKTGSQPGNSFPHTLSTNNCDDSVFLHTSRLQFPGKKNEERIDERERQPTGPVMKESSEEEVTSARAAEETETLQEMADVLLLLKQRRN